MAKSSKAPIIVAAALAAHIPSLRAGWVLDDWELLVENPYLRSTSGLRKVLTSELFVASGDPRRFPYYRPVSGFVYWLTYQVFGANGFAHHAFNAALHALSALLFFFLAQRLKVSARAALVMSLVFAVHPISADVVAYAGGRQDVLGWIFTLGAMLLILRAPPSRSVVHPFALALAGTLLAALTREFFLATPALFAVAATAATANERDRRRSAIAAIAGGGLAIGTVLAIRRALAITPFGSDLAPARIIGAAGAVLLRFTRDAFAPTDLAADVTLFPLPPGTGALVLALATMVLALGFRAVKRRTPSLVFAYATGAVAFAALVVMHAPVALRFGIVSDRYAYGAVIALLFAFAPAIDALVTRIEPAKTKLFVFAVAALTIALVPLTWARAADYANDETLTLALIRERPDDPRALLSQIVSAQNAGRAQTREVYPLCHRYAEQLPGDIVVNSCLAAEALDQKNDARAIELLEPWLRASPTDARARDLYFQALFHLGDMARVKSAVERFEAIAPDAPDVRAARAALPR